MLIDAVVDGLGPNGAGWMFAAVAALLSAVILLSVHAEVAANAGRSARVFGPVDAEGEAGPPA